MNVYFKIALIIGFQLPTIVQCLASNGEMAKDKRDWELTITKKAPEICMGEPLQIEFSVKNITTVSRGMATYDDVIAIMFSRDGKIFKENKSAVTYKSSGSRDAIEVKRGESQTFSEIILFSVNNVMGGDGDLKWLVFPKPGKYYVKVGFRDLLSAGAGSMPPDSFTAEQIFEVLVKEPAQADLAAWEIYKNEGIFRYVQYYGFSNRNESDNKEEYDRAYIGKDSNRDSIDLKVNQILKKHPATVYAKILQNIQQGVRAKSDPKSHSKNDGGRPLRQRAQQELEDEWYDVKGLFKQNAEALKMYLDVEGELLDQMADGKIFEEEFDRLTGQELKKVVKKYSNPLLPEEWKRRYAVYATEEAKEEEVDYRKFEEWKRKHGHEMQKQLHEAKEKK